MLVSSLANFIYLLLLLCYLKCKLTEQSRTSKPANNYQEQSSKLISISTNVSTRCPKWKFAPDHKTRNPIPNLFAKTSNDNRVVFSYKIDIPSHRVPKHFKFKSSGAYKRAIIIKSNSWSSNLSQIEYRLELTTNPEKRLIGFILFWRISRL